MSEPCDVIRVVIFIQLLEFVDRGSETQLQVVEIYLFLLNLGPNICKS